MKRTRLAVVAGLVGAALTLAGCGGSDALAPDTSSAPPADAGTIVVGSANFPENVVLAEIYAQALQGKGLNVQTRLNIGSRETYIPSLEDGSISVIPEYTGVLLQYFDKNATAVDPEGVYTALKAALPEGLSVLDMSSAEDKDAVVVTKETAEKDHLTTIADLAPYASQMVLGGPPEWKTRETGVPGLKKVYGLNFKSFKPLDVAGPLTVQALKSGIVQAANLFTTQSAIAENDFVVLQDPKNLFAAQNVVPLIRTDKVDDTVTSTLNAVSAALDTEQLADLVKQAEVDKTDPATIAKNWLASKNLG